MTQYNRRCIKQMMNDLLIKLDDFNKIKHGAYFNKQDPT